MICNLQPNWCIANLFFACFSSIIFTISCYQTFTYFRGTPNTTKILKSIIITTNFLNLFLILHFIFVDKEYAVIFVFTEFFLYFDFCLIAMFYLFQASKHLEDSGTLVKLAKFILITIIGILIILFVYFLIIVSIHALDYSDCSNTEWAVVKYTTFGVGCAFFGVGLKLSYRIKQKRKQGAIVMSTREKELW